MARRVSILSAPSELSTLSTFSVPTLGKAEKLKKVEKKEAKDDDETASTASFFATLIKDIRKCFSNNFCTMADAIDAAVLKHFDSSLSSRELQCGEIEPDLKRLVIMEKEDFQVLMETIFESLGAALDEYGQKTEPKCLRNVLLPICMHVVPSVLGELLMARRFDASMVNLIFDFTKCDDFISFFPGRDPQDIKELYFSGYPTNRLLRSITNFLTTAPAPTTIFSEVEPTFLTPLTQLFNI